jgi:hypothetical protein
LANGLHPQELMAVFGNQKAMSNSLNSILK